MIHLSCLCGGVSLTVETRPAFINACNCTLCGKTGARWGYFHPAEVSVLGETRGFRRQDKAEANAEVNFCPVAGRPPTSC